MAGVILTMRRPLFGAERAVEWVAMESSQSVKSESRTQVRRNEAKWTKPLIEAGWTLIPDVIIERQRALGLTPVDVNVLLHLIRRWWTADNPPYPAMKDIAERMDVSLSTVQRSLRRMKKANFLDIRERYDHRGQTTNSYHFEGLIKAVTPYAEEALAERVKRQEDEQERRTRKRPRVLQVVESKGPKGSKR